MASMHNMYRNKDYTFQISGNKCNVHICQSPETKKKRQRKKKSPTQSTIWMNRSYDNFKVIKLVCLCETGFSPSKSALKMASHSSAIHKKVSTICNFMVSNSFLISKIWIYRLIHGTSKARSLDPLDYISTSLF